MPANVEFSLSLLQSQEMVLRCPEIQVKRRFSNGKILTLLSAFRDK